MSTKYTLQVDGDATEFVKATKATVVAEAARVRKAGEKGLIEVVTNAGTVVHSLPAVKTRIVTFHTKPYTKTIVLPEAIAALVPEGYASAYTRSTRDAVVLRRENDIPEDDARYAVMRRSSGALVAFVGTTRDAGQVMKGMRPPVVVAA